MGNAARVTQRDIARRLGISHVSVSLALRSNTRISPALTRRIQDAARSMGYRPDPMLGALNRYRDTRKKTVIRSSLAWVSLWRPPADPRDFAEFALYWQGARATAERHGYHLDHFMPAAHGSFAHLQRVLDARGTRGLLLSPPQEGFRLPPGQIDWSRLCALRFGHALPDLPLHVVTAAQTTNAALASYAMHERGYRRIGFVTTRSAGRRTRFLAGFLQAQALDADAGPLPPLLMDEADSTADLHALDAWLRRHRPDAVLTDLRPLRGMLAALGLVVPRDLSLAALSVHDGEADAGIDQNPRVIGETACETLIALLEQGASGLPKHPREILVGGRWADGATLPRR